MKSNVSDLLELAQVIYKDACAKCIADVSDLRDLRTIKSRVKDEGVSFLTITLPSFCKDLEQSLQLGLIDPTLFRSFRKSGSIPAFLQGMIGLIFDHETGRIYDDQHPSWIPDCSTIIDSIRQICLAFKKIELVCSPLRITNAIRSFTENEHSTQLFSLPKEDAEEYSSVSSVLWGNSMANISLCNLSPKHGPGSTADGKSGNRKYQWRRWHDRLEPFFPLIDSAYTMGAYQSEELKLVTIVNQEQEQPVKVITVPKTMNGPRIIAIEPCCMQYAQQAIRSVLYNAIESSRFTSGHINFRDQTKNQELALISSKTGQFATIDLSDASDRVPRDLALEMFRSNPDLRDSIDACRSTNAMLPNGTIIGPLGKFASMGSALCFPIESMYFYTICVAALLKVQNLPVNHANVFIVSRDVFVYGDDIVVPATYAIAVLDYLQKYNCKVNNAKTFVTGKFRESCGVDAYNGELVTPVYLRTIRPKNRHQASELISWVATANSFYKKGYWNTAQLMFCTCERILGSLPYVSETSQGLGRISMLGYRSVERWNRKTQLFEMKCWVASPVYRSDSVDGYPALFKSLGTLERGELALSDFTSSLYYPERENNESRSFGSHRTVSPDSRDAHHLERSALHGAVALTRRWVPSLY